MSARQRKASGVEETENWVKEVRTAIQWLKAKRANGNEDREKRQAALKSEKGQVFRVSCGTILSVCIGSNQVMRFACFEMYMCTVTYLDIRAYYMSMFVLL